MSELPIPLAQVERRRSSKTLIKTIFDASSPEQYIRTIPAQSLYTAIRYNGLESSLELLEMASIEQCRLLLDFDLWERDRLSEDRLWQWLALSEEEEEFAFLQKLLKSIDLKLVGLLISRYVESVTFDEPTDQPPGPGYYTPDHGHTWIHLKIPDSDRHFRLAKFLALIFETSGELFYQLLGIPAVATDSGLEEEAYQERLKRLAAEGVPEPEYASTLIAPLAFSTIEKELSAAVVRRPIEGIRAIEPIIYDTPCEAMLRDLLSAGGEQLEEELTLLINAAIVRFNIDFAETEQVTEFVSSVKGAIMIGIETVQKKKPALDVAQIYRTLGLVKIFGLGLQTLQALTATTKNFRERDISELDVDQALFSIVAGLREAFPRMPRFVLADGSFEEQDGKLTSGFKAIESLRDVDALHKTLELLKNKR